MRRACLLLSLGAIVAIAQDRGFVNSRLLKADLLKPKPNAKVKVVPIEKPCVRLDAIERIVPKDVDKSMVIQPKSPSGDDKMVLPSPPFCRDGIDQGRPKN